jgi:hypothetical protein
LEPHRYPVKPPFKDAGRNDFAPYGKGQPEFRRMDITSATPGEPQDAVHKPKHYANYPIEPIHFILENKVPFCEANAIKYIMRHRMKNGREDIAKAIRYLEILLEREYPTK